MGFEEFKKQYKERINTPKLFTAIITTIIVIMLVENLELVTVLIKSGRSASAIAIEGIIIIGFLGMGLILYSWDRVTKERD